MDYIDNLFYTKEILVDDVRSAITEEKRRTELIKTLRKLEK